MAVAEAVLLAALELWAGWEAKRVGQEAEAETMVASAAVRTVVERAVAPAEPKVMAPLAAEVVAQAAGKASADAPSAHHLAHTPNKAHTCREKAPRTSHCSLHR